MIQIAIQPILSWPRNLTNGRRHSTFKANYSQTVDLLEKELRHLHAHSVAIQLAIQASDIRIDGLMRANTTPSHPGIILVFTGKHGHVTMPCDRYAHWHCNLRAIALSLEALRSVDRYGVTTSGEQYRGWKQLGGAIELRPVEMTVEEAAEFMGSSSHPSVRQILMSDVNTFRETYRAAALKFHPDSGGSRSDWDKLQAAAAVLKKHHQIA